MTKFFVVGKIVNTHGVRGEVRVISTSDFTDERYEIGNTLHIHNSENNTLTNVVIKSHRKHKQFDLLSFEGYDNLNDVEQFKGKSLKVSEDQLNELDEHEFYYHEIIGCTVLGEDGEKLGVIKEILSPGANDVWVMKRPKGKDVYIPYIEDVVKKVDVQNKEIIIHLMEGLIEE